MNRYCAGPPRSRVTGAGPRSPRARPVPSGNSLEKDALGDHVEMPRKRLEITRCLARPTASTTSTDLRIDRRSTKESTDQPTGSGLLGPDRVVDFHDLGDEAILVVFVQLEFDGEAVVEQTPHVAREIA